MFYESMPVNTSAFDCVTAIGTAMEGFNYDRYCYNFFHKLV